VQGIAGIVQEMIDRLQERNSVHVVDKSKLGMEYQPLIDLYLQSGFSIFFLRKRPDNGEYRLAYGALIEPEILKNQFNEMCLEAGVDVLLHSWGTRPIMEGNRVCGVYFESKSGRQAIRAKVVIDSTGDGDLFYQAGAGYDDCIDPKRRHSHLAMSCWFAGIDNAKWNAFKKDNPEEYAELMAEMRGQKKHAGMVEAMDEVSKNTSHFMDGFFQDILPNHAGIAIAQPHYPAKDQTDVEELTHTDMTIRARHVHDWEFMRDHIPGWEKSYIVQTAPQLGTLGGKRVEGEYCVTMDDLRNNTVFEDTIAMFPNNETKEMITSPLLCIPYRALIPKGLEGLLVACRGFSSTDEVNESWNLIPHCMCFGEAAGTAAAMAVQAGVGVRDVDIPKLQANLAEHGVVLP
jgi:hypothetical protein